jgi:lipopolysaccharide export LptBFGC system permease protein LptF
MHRLDQQLLARLTMTFVLILAVVTLSAVLSQAARLTDDILERGMSIEQFGLMLLALTPKMAELVTPLSFGVAVVLVCVHRTESGTTLLLRTAGRSPLSEVGVLTLFAMVMAGGLLAISGSLIPASQKTYRLLNAELQQVGLDEMTLPVGVPFEVGEGVRLTIGAHVDDGLYQDLFVVDYSAAEETLILTAKTATLKPSVDGRGVLTLEQGQLQRVSSMGQQTSVNFVSTSLALDLPSSSPNLTVVNRADTRSSLQLAAEIADAAAAEELTRRLAAAISLISFSALTALVLFDRRPQATGQALPALILIGVLIAFLLLQSALISASGFSPETAMTVLVVSAAPLIILPFISLGRRFAR